MSGWIAKNGERSEVNPKTVSDAVPYGKYKGVPLRDMKDKGQLNYLLWMLKKNENEEEWGDAIRKHFKDVGFKYEVGDDRPIYVAVEALDKFSVLFGDQWLSKGMGVKSVGLFTFMEKLAFQAWDVARRSNGDCLIRFERNSPAESCVTHNGIIWHLRDTGVSLQVLDVSDAAEEKYEDEEAIPF